MAKIVVALALSLWAFSPAAAVPLKRSISTSRQFIVYGPDAQLRGAICDLAENTKKGVLTLLQQADGWRTPIIVNADYPQANLPEMPAARLNFSQTGFGLKLQLDLTIAPDVAAPAVERALLRAIFLEWMYREEPGTPAGTPYVEPPAWLLEGVLAQMPGRHSAALAQTLERPVGANRVTPLDEFLRRNPALLDSPSLALYRAYAAALVSMITGLPDGRTQLARFLSHLPRAGNESLAELQTQFPALGDTREKIEKAWIFNVTKFAGRESYRLLGSEETERQLAGLLRVEVHESGQPASVYTLEEFPKFAHDTSSRADLKRLTEKLLLLSAQANPLYRPVIGEYQEIVAGLIRGRTRKVPERLARVRALREELSRRMGEIGDYMNWFEATQSRTASGAFREYLRAAESSRQSEPRRRDPISVYLDVLEAQF